MPNTLTQEPAVPNEGMAVAKELLAPDRGFMSIIEKLAIEPTLQSVEVIERMMAAHERWEARQAEKQFNEAMMRLKEKLPIITKKGLISFSGVDKKGNAYSQETPYAKYEDIHKAIKPFLKEEGFSVTYPLAVGDKPLVTFKISHIGGHSDTSSMTLPLDTSGSKNNLQGAGSTVSYCKRYLLTSYLDIISEGEDNDGNGAPITEEQAEDIKTALKETGSDVKKFLSYMKAESVEEIPTKNYQKAKSLLDSKKAKQAKEKAI